MEISYKFEPFFELLDKHKVKKYKNIRYVVLIGGRGSAKSFALATWVNKATYNKGWGILFTRWTMESATKSIIPEFKRQCDKIGNAEDFSFLNTQVKNNLTDAVIDYNGMKPQSNQSKGALKSVAGKNIFILEEAEDCPDFEMFDKIENGIRTIEHKNLVILCLNQGHVNHWIYKEFIEQKRDDLLIIETTYLDNIRFLDELYLKKIEKVKKRDLKRYEHIYLNKWQSEVHGALWLLSDISSSRLTIEEFENNYKPHLKEIVIGYDPAVTNYTTSGINTKAPDEDGIIIAAEDNRNHYYVVADESCHGTRNDIAQKLVLLYRKYNCSYIVVEKNNGGDWIPTLIKNIDRYIRVKTVTATKGKALRAQPIQAIYEQGDVHHVGHFADLEYEMTTWIPNIGMKSPNRIDGCLIGETKIITKLGIKRLSRITTKDLVLTRKGYNKVKISQKTQTNASVLLVLTSKGRYIIGTNNHPVYSNKKWINIGNLKKGDILCIAKSEKLLNSMAIDMLDTQIIKEKSVEITIQTLTNLVECYTKQFLNIIKGKYQQNMLYIMLTLIHSTMILIIWFVLQLKNIITYIIKISVKKAKEKILIKLDHSLKCGMLVKKAKNGIKNMGKKFGKIENQYMIKSAKYVKKSLNRIKSIHSFVLKIVYINLIIKPKDIVLMYIVLYVTKYLNKINTNIYPKHVQEVVVDILSVRKKNDVYNLEIENNHEYFANGILVHNCVWAITALSTRSVEFKSFIL